MKHLKYLRYVMRHKLFVFMAGLKTGAPVHRLIIHDWSKFLPSEWFAYAEFFYGKGRPGREKMGAYSASNQKDENFVNAWLRHQNRQAHHWQFWILLQDNPGSTTDQPGPQYALCSVSDLDTTMSIVDYASGSRGEDRINVPDVGISDGPDAQKRYLLASRLVKAANRCRTLPIPESYVREMVADWMGAGRAITGKWDILEWYERNKDNMMLHPDSRALVEQILNEIFPGRA